MSDAVPAGLETPVAPSESDSGESSLTVLLALAANAGVGILKLAAGLISGSSALLSEAAHSVGDVITELMLLVALKRSAKPADRTHPFGYGKERYFWSLIAAVAIFVAGAIFSFYQGYETITGPEEGIDKLWVNYPVLLLAAVLEGISLRQAIKQMKGETKRLHLTIRDYVRTPRDPTVNSVLLEDSAAITGLAFAGIGVALHQITGNKLWDGLASIAIGLLLLTVTLTLARACESLLIGKQADVRFVRATEAWLEEQPEVDDVVDVLTMLTGVDSVLLCARVDFVDTTTGGELEQACVRLDTEMREKWPFLDEIFIQPASRKDARLRPGSASPTGTARRWPKSESWTSPNLMAHHGVVTSALGDQLDELAPLRDLLGAGGVVVLSGAGLSTESGIPDYRGPSGSHRTSTPMTIQQFTATPAARRRYWARSHLGWRQIADADPNDGHRAVARLQQQGRLAGIITQNVDGLHQAAGAHDVIELHGGLDVVVCLDCQLRESRASLGRRLSAANPDFGAEVTRVNPDGDAELADAALEGFVLVGCARCDSDRIKPDVVFFGESVPKPRVETCFALVESARSLLVLGSSLTVMSGLRFVRRAAKLGIPVAIVNQGETRGDPLADVKLEAPLGQVLPALVG